MTDRIPVRRALLSVSDKAGIVEFARFLAARGAEILSTGGTAAAIRAAGVAVKDVSEHTGFPEILDGRVKTLVPQVHGGLLGRRHLAGHRAQMEAHGIAPIDLVAVNLYPFEATVAAGAGFDECIENIDIGGPAMIRSAAKNHASVVVVTEPEQLAEVRAELEQGGTTLPLRRRLAHAAYARTAAYDAAIIRLVSRAAGGGLPPRLATAGVLRQQPALRREPAHQAAAFYADGTRTAGARTSERQVQGKELLLQQPERHRRRASNAPPSSGGPRSSSSSMPTPAAWRRRRPRRRRGTCALRCDPVFGLRRHRGGEPDAGRPRRRRRIAAILHARWWWRPTRMWAPRRLRAQEDLRLLLTGAMPDPAAPWVLGKSRPAASWRRRATPPRDGGDARVVTRARRRAEMADLLFAFRVCKHVKSNAIVYAKDARRSASARAR
jgi:phosphoribosylaminoimidazolecarboxamide formyltransferase/IMP cyclohydrolase